jgi:hypothetical protein
MSATATTTDQPAAQESWLAVSPIAALLYGGGWMLIAFAAVHSTTQPAQPAAG